MSAVRDGGSGACFGELAWLFACASSVPLQRLGGTAWMLGTPPSPAPCVLADVLATAECRTGIMNVGVNTFAASFAVLKKNGP